MPLSPSCGTLASSVPDGGIVLALQRPPLRREDDEAVVVTSRSW
ncbi:MAG: hypothetical protein ACKO9B_02260 [Planctomycetota bacterium]